MAMDMMCFYECEVCAPDYVPDCAPDCSRRLKPTAMRRIGLKPGAASGIRCCGHALPSLIPVTAARKGAGFSPIFILAEKEEKAEKINERKEF
ncbi:MAG: hypothetical protein LBF85_09800 [Tannerella sp.]|jgi:hypothetical protein|nr:hypothetical protein [Tannerella sp.]